MRKKLVKTESEEPVSRVIAKERLKRTIQSERMKMPEDVMAMMQSDLRELIERYLGESAKDTELVLEVHKPTFTAAIPWSGDSAGKKTKARI